MEYTVITPRAYVPSRLAVKSSQPQGLRYYKALKMVVIRLGLEPRTHALEGRCSNPTELPEEYSFSEYYTAKIMIIIQAAKFLNKINNKNNIPEFH